MKATRFCTSVAPVVAVEVFVFRELRAACSTTVEVAEEAWTESSAWLDTGVTFGGETAAVVDSRSGEGSGSVWSGREGRRGAICAGAISGSGLKAGMEFEVAAEVGRWTDWGGHEGRVGNFSFSFVRWLLLLVSRSLSLLPPR